MPIAPALQRRAEAAAELLQAQREVTVVHHIDADGVAAGALASEGLRRAGIKARTMAVRSMDDAHVEKVHASAPASLWMCDLGSVVYQHFDVPTVVCDHHQLVRDGSEDFDGHVNPMLDDLPGTDISGAGATWLVASALADMDDLLPTALVGACADLQDRDGALHGSNAALVRTGQDAEVVEAAVDLGFYGLHTRPLDKLLAYADAPAIPGVARDRRAAAAFLEMLGVPADRTWDNIRPEARVAVRSAIVDRLLDCGLQTDGLWRQVITFPREAAGAMTKEARAFGTLLNGTARYGRPEVGLAVAAGDRGEALAQAMSLLRGHRSHLVSSIRAFEGAINETPALRWVHVGDQVRDTVLGTVTGMALSRLGLGDDKPLVAFADAPAGLSKVSSRAPRRLQALGIDLAAAMRAGAEAVGGQGGGHAGAAGASIPRGSEPTFLAAVEAHLVDAPVKPQQP